MCSIVYVCLYVCTRLRAHVLRVYSENTCTDILETETTFSKCYFYLSMHTGQLTRKKKYNKKTIHMFIVHLIHELVNINRVISS